MISSTPTTVTDRDFATEVLSANQPVLVYFWASWCGPCRLMSPILDKLAAEYGDHLKIVKMEVDPNPESVAVYQVEGVPAFRLFKAGEVVESSEGAISQQKLQSLIAPHLAAPN
ncbi:thioredoxin [Thermocoleostomius sinensis]|jgi:thioredoxin 1|uniref:Thioredoxin n=1 Tax=Thermocoleostomius sinensis A174 TaxID=2016057 RepID=A0A9E8Z974_9CYAN|nr:thioredoxin [Thermocoleostomius sinensis]WAL58840.1 thioredoxin [Thermocoleostomius sinensis A174]